MFCTGAGLGHLRWNLLDLTFANIVIVVDRSEADAAFPIKVITANVGDDDDDDIGIWSGNLY